MKSKQILAFSMLFVSFSYTQSFSINYTEKYIQKRALQKSHEKPQWLKWYESIMGAEQVDQVPSLVKLITTIATSYLSDCTPIILYDKFTEDGDNLLLEKLFRDFPMAYISGQINDDYTMTVSTISTGIKTCVSYILFMQDVMRSKEVIGEQITNKVVVIARSSQWRVYEFLSSENSQCFTNLLVVAKSEKVMFAGEETTYILCTHKLFTDALGSSTPQVITSWLRGKLTRPQANLFPKKITEGFAGHRFIISLSNQPPFVIKKGRDENSEYEWDGIEIRLVNLLSKIYNFTTDYREVKDDISLGSAESVTQPLLARKSDLGLAGVYITDDRTAKIDVSQWHSQDCASFISLTSIALPRYRAIMGPFHWTVWIALTSVYLLAIFPLVFSDKHTLKHLIESPEEMENMFWYVFGTFTNCFTFIGKASWSKADKVTTRLLMGFYWLFTIIITACYTGSIIAFVTLPVYPTAVDKIEQLISGRYDVGTLDRGGWQYWFQNSSDPIVQKIMKKIELLPDVESGLKNTTKAFFWPYAFIGSQAQLDYIVRTNFSTTSKRSLLHISKECFATYNVGLLYPKNAIYKEIFNTGINNAIQSGFMEKLKKDVEWYMMRSATGKLLSANTGGGGLKALTVEDRALTLDDTQGMFLLLGAGFLMGAASLLSEWLGGCFHLCQRRKRRDSNSSIESNPRSHERQTPRQRLASRHYNQMVSYRLKSITDTEMDKESYHTQQNEHVQNHVDCIVHNDNDKSENVSFSQENDNDNEEKDENEDSDTDYEEEINKLFNFEDLFGEEPNSDNCENTKEEIISLRSQSKSK